MEDVNVLKERFLKVQKLFNSKKKNKIKLALEILDGVLEGNHAVDATALVESQVWLVSHAVRSGSVDNSLVELKHHLGFSALDVFTLCDALWQLIDICVKTYAQEALLGENLLYKFFSVHNMVFTMIHRSDNRNDE